MVNDENEPDGLACSCKCYLKKKVSNQIRRAPSAAARGISSSPNPSQTPNAVQGGAKPAHANAPKPNAMRCPQSRQNPCTIPKHVLNPYISREAD